MTSLGPNRYGKSAIRLVKVDRSTAGDRVRDLTIAISLEGDFAASYVDGDNSLVVATDTMKNTVYALAGEHLTGPIETFGCGARPALPARRAGRAGHGLDRRVRLAADRRSRSTRSCAIARRPGRPSSPRTATG